MVKHQAHIQRREAKETHHRANLRHTQLRPNKGSPRPHSVMQRAQQQQKAFYATESETATSSKFVSAFLNNSFEKFKDEHLIIPNKLQTIKSEKLQKIATFNLA